MAPPTNLQQAVNLRTALDMELTLVEQAILVCETSPIDQTDTEIYISVIAPMRADLNGIHERILNTMPSEMDTHNSTYADMTTRIHKAHSFLVRLQKSFAPQVPTSTPSIRSSIRVPAIEIPTFTGRFEDWLSFKDIYEAVIHNSTLSDVEKFTYLKTKVQDEALSLISNIPVTSQDYHEAWNMLQDRYNNDREIVNSHVKRLFNIPSVKNGSAAQIQSLLDTTNECLRALKVLQQPVDSWDTLLIHITVEKMDVEAKKHWALSLQHTTVPTFKELNDFFQKYIRGLQAGQVTAKPSNDKRASTHVIHSNNPPTPKCPKCYQHHPIYKCAQFLSLSVKERNTFATQQNLCYNCLKPSSKTHNTNNCSSSSCRICKHKHNTLLHYPRPTPNDEPTQTQRQPNNAGAKSSNITRGDSDILLSTAVVKVQDCSGAFQTCRVLLDNGSQATLITEDCVRRLGLMRKYDRTRVTGVSSTSAGTTRGKVNVMLNSCISNERIAVEALILTTVTSEVPRYTLQREWNHISGLTLADPEFHEPGNIDILLGADYTAAIMRDGRRQKDIESPFALNTMFGWVLSGRVKVKSVNTVRIHHTQYETDYLLQRFWEIDNVPKPQHFTADEKECEETFVQTYKRLEDGKFCVKLPIKNNISQLGYSRDQAVRRWKSVEKRLSKNDVYKEEYSKFMKVYLDLGHMTMIPRGEAYEELGKTYYLPHHFVTKPDSTTTKFRVVFDASAKTSTGTSLNDCMLVGATLQSDIFTLLLKFRVYQIAIKADIAKMFRQFKVDKDHTSLQRIVWRENETDPIQDYELQTVTYGTASAPFLSTRCIQELAEVNKSNYPATASKLASELYVDDLMSGMDTVEGALTFIDELNTIAESAGLSFRKWSSNNCEVLQSIPEDFRESALPLSFDKESNVKALGIQWNPKADTFTFSKPDVKEDVLLTKRAVLSQLAKIYDPLGFLTPITICAKLFMQKLWKCSLGWDENLSEEMKLEWSSYCDNLSNIGMIQIPRCMNPPVKYKREIHAFCDASEAAYGAVIYLRSETEPSSYEVKLLASKSRVAPLKTVSLPRLELCGALLLTELYQQVTEAIKLDCDVYAWTDSMIVLQWLNSHPQRWQTFVANRVAKIQEVIPFSRWSHVISEKNPADLVSRGVTTKMLSNNSLWWSGPDWLLTNVLPEKAVVTKGASTSSLEERKQKLFSAHVKLDTDIINRFSSLNRMKRTVAYILRFASNCKSKLRQHSSLSVAELNQAMEKVISIVQRQSFSEEIKCLQRKQPVSSKSKLSSLVPFLDDKGIMRVGGRLQKAFLQAGAKHQLIIPSNSHFTKLIINDAHLLHGHGGNKLVWCFLRESYWIQSARNIIRYELRKCVICRRHRAEKMTQLMGALPATRVTPGRVFMNCGVDYAGPYNLRVMKGRSNKLFKGYFSIFICMATKAVHLEPVSDLTTEAFIATLKRFVSRRGLPVSIHSDNGTNFKGADRELQQLFQDQQHNHDVSDYLSTHNIQWKYIPASASHQGGIWEAGVKGTKFHLKRIIGDTTLTFEEFGTILCQVESYLNSRPLCALSSDIDDFDALTPGHFIIGQPLTAIPSPDLTSLKVNKLSRWQFTQQVSHHFWKRWRAEYLTTLQQRWKWQRKSDNLSIGDLVIVHEEHVPPAKWKLARIVDLHPGQDGCVRVVTIKTRTGTTKRPINKLTPILYESE